MKKIFLGISLMLATDQIYGQKRSKNPEKQTTQAMPQAAPDLKNDKLNYAIATVIGKKLMADNIVLKPEMFYEALKALSSGSEPLMKEEEIMLTLQAFEQEMREKAVVEEIDTAPSEPENTEIPPPVDSAAADQVESEELSEYEAGRLKAAAKNEAKGKAWLEANKKNPGIIELPSGLQYQVIRKGKGNSPKSSSKVLVQYVGTRLDGSVFDSSIERDMPAVLPVNGVIKGWSEALQLMNPGAKWKLFVPASLAYGNAGTDPIEPGEMLIFEVELLYVLY